MLNIANHIGHVPESDHKTYAHTFLHWIIVKINYSAHSHGDQYELLRKFFSRYPGLDFNREVYEGMKTVPVRIKSTDGIIILKIDDSFIQLKIKGVGYKNFESSVKPYLDSFSALLTDLEAYVLSIELRKVNLLAYPSEDNSMQNDNGLKIMELALSDSLNSEWKPTKSEEEGEEIQLTRLFGEEKIDNKDCSMTVIYGFIHPLKNNPNKMSRVILDTQIESESKMSGSQISGMFKAINNRLFDIFHWAISDNILKVMEK